VSVPPFILGIDPGSNHLGWCLLHEGAYDMSGVISAKKKDSLLQRRDYIRTELYKVFQEVPPSPNTVMAIEDPMSRGIGTAKVLATIRTMAEEMGFNFGWAFLQVLPHEWHGMVYEEDGRREGESVKDLALRVANGLTKGRITSEDESDAFWIAKYVFSKAR